MTPQDHPNDTLEYIGGLAGVGEDQETGNDTEGSDDQLPPHVGPVQEHGEKHACPLDHPPEAQDHHQQGQGFLLSDQQDDPEDQGGDATEQEDVVDGAIRRTGHRLHGCSFSW